MDDNPVEKKPYRKPELKNYGRIERLTTGGSGPDVEGVVISMGMEVMDMAMTKAKP